MALFRHLPDEIFRPLAAPNRAFYAALLLHLYDRTFTIIGDTPRRAEVIEEIGAFIEDYAAIHELPPEDEVVLTGVEARDRDPRRYLAFHRLLQTGWLIEYRDRYRRLVDFDPDARLLLQELARIATGDTRSYGGAVLQVLGSLESAADNPEERSEAIRNAARFSRDFMQHLRTVSAAMRKIEETILAQNKLRDLFRAVFEQLVEGYLIQDFETLYTRNNPFRFRTRIIRKAWDIAKNVLLLEALTGAYIRGRGRRRSSRPVRFSARSSTQFSRSSRASTINSRSSTRHVPGSSGGLPIRCVTWIGSTTADSTA